MKATAIFKKAAAVVLCLLLTAALGLSVIFIAVEQQHDCTGDSCPICLQLRQASALLQKMGHALTAALRGALRLLMLTSPFITLIGVLLRCKTPVTCRVRMDD